MAVAGDGAEFVRSSRPSTPRVLVLRALGLGDLLTAVPALRAVAAAFPGHRRLLAMPRTFEPLLPLIFGDVPAEGFEVVDVRSLRPLPGSLHEVELAVNLHGRGPQSHRALLRLRPGRLIAFRSPGIRGLGGPDWRAGEHEVRRWCRLLAESGIAADPRALDIAAPPAPVPSVARGATLIHPGAASPARRWPGERWAAVAREELGRGRQVVLTGSADERPLAESIARSAGVPPENVLAGRTGLVELAGLVHAAGRVACGDTGVAHLATALRTPSVVLFGPTPPEEWGPPSGRCWHRVLWAGDMGDPHAARTDPGLLRFGPEDVGAALADLPAGELAQA